MGGFEKSPQLTSLLQSQYWASSAESSSGVKKIEIILIPINRNNVSSSYEGFE